MIGRDNYEEWPSDEIEKTLVNVNMFLDDAPNRIRQLLTGAMSAKDSDIRMGLTGSMHMVQSQIETAITVRERLTGILKERGDI